MIIWVRKVISWLLVLTSLALVLSMIIIPRLSGSQVYTVLTGSMEPTLRPGTLIVTRPADPETVAVGDVITYQIESGKPEVVTHRVVATSYAAKGAVTFRTRGDNNATIDSDPVQPAQVRGTVWYSVPYVGHLNSWVTGERRTVMLGVVVSALMIYAATMFISAARERRQRSRESELAA